MDLAGVSAPGTGVRALCLNAGSSSLKAALYVVGEPGASSPVGHGDEREVWRWSGEGADPVEALRALAAAGEAPPDVVGHRVVHGGTGHARPAPVDDELLADLRALVPVAPLHQPAALAGIEAVRDALPGVPQVACFDTAFHHTLPEEAARLPLPERFWRDGVRRYGFHGLSYEYVVEHVGARVLGRAVIAHLGNGASLCAVRDGCSVDTSMGFTPTGGVVMGTRPGDLDPGLLVHLLTEEGFTAAALEHLVNHESGLLGLSGSSSDMRTLLQRRAAGDERAALAIRVFCRAVRKQIAAYTGVLGGLDSLVFTAGIGEHAPEVRAEVCEGLGFLGVRVDPDRNAAPDLDGGAISPTGAGAVVRVVATDEDRMIARHAAALLANGGAVR